MNTPAPTAQSTSYFGTTLRVTTKAIELRDRSYRLDSVKSARAVRIRSNRTTLALLFILCVAAVLFVFYSLRMVLDTYINSDGSDLNRWVALACLVFNLVAIGGLVIFYRSTRKGWYFIYIARLHRKLWYTDIAASFHPEPIEQLAMAVNQALELARVGEAQSEADTLYYEEQSIRLEDNSIIINGQMQSTENVKYASMDVVTGTPWYMLALSYAWIFLVASVYGTLSRSFSSTGALVLIIGVAVVVFLSMVVAGKVVQITNKDKRYSTSGAYECKLHTADQTMLAFISVDKEFVRATVDAVNAVVRSHAADSKRPSASRPSHRTT